MSRKNKRNRTARPDEVAEYGPIRMARYGKLTVQDANFSKEQHQEFKDKLAENYPIVCTEIDQAVAEFISIARELDPVELLKRAYWEMAVTHIKIETEVQVSQEHIIATHFLAYLQNIIVASPPTGSKKPDDSSFDKLRTVHGIIFNKTTDQYPLCDTAKQQKEGTFDEALEKIRIIARMFYNVVWGKQYQSLETEILAVLLTPHDPIFQELFGTAVQEFIDAITSIQHALTKGIIEASDEMKQFHKDSMERIEEKIASSEASNKDFGEIIQESIAENGWQGRGASIIGRLFGDDLFDLQKVTKLPISILEALSLSPGEDTTFLDATKPFKGWPLRYYPIRSKPFLKANGKYYCYSLFILTDNIYRALYKSIKDLKPDYANEWQKKQGKVVEEYAFVLFSRLLPKAELLRNQWYPNVLGKTKDWFETDGLVCFDDSLFIIEVKGGAFSPYSPTTNFEGFQKSISELIGKPYTQGRRFLEYLESAGTVQLYDEKHNPTKKMSLSDFRSIILCSVTLEQLTNLGGKLAELKALGTEIDTTKRPVWSISIDDLRVYVDLIKNPLVFCHYLEQRNAAVLQLNNLVIVDELDHFGAYLAHNNYAMHFSELPEFSSLYLNGYRTPIDKYYYDRLVGDNPTPPTQKLPSLIQQIIDILSQQNKSGRSKLANYLLDLSGKTRDNFFKLIIDGLSLQQRTGRAKIFSIGGVNISAVCHQDGVSLIGVTDIRNDVLAAMLHANDNFRFLLKLKFTKDSCVYDVDFDFLRREDITSENEKEIKEIAEIQKKKRLKNYLIDHKKIGRNDICPCGSNKKYKRCHGK